MDFLGPDVLKNTTDSAVLGIFGLSFITLFLSLLVSLLA